MSAATSSTAALFFVTALVVLLALMLIAVFRLPEWQPKGADGGGAPLLPSVPAQASAAPAGAAYAGTGPGGHNPGGPAGPPVAAAGPSLFQAAEAAGASRLPRRAATADWAEAAARPTGTSGRLAEAGPLGGGGEASPRGGPGEAIPLGEHGRLGEPALLGEAGARPGDPGYAVRRDREQLEQATVGRVVVPGSPPWGPAPKPPGIP